MGSPVRDLMGGGPGGVGVGVGVGGGYHNLHGVMPGQGQGHHMGHQRTGSTGTNSSAGSVLLDAGGDYNAGNIPDDISLLSAGTVCLSVCLPVLLYVC